MTGEERLLTERVLRYQRTRQGLKELLALLAGVAHLPYPFLPRHITLVGSLTIGIPGFFLALASSCGLATLHFSGAGYPNTAGGVVGTLLGEGLDRAMSFLGYVRPDGGVGTRNHVLVIPQGILAKTIGDFVPVRCWMS
mgnify:CR=1 FL=1